MPKLKVLLLTGRTIDQGVGRERGKLTQEYMKNVAISEMDPDDMKRLQVSENDNVRVSTDFGTVVMRAVKSKSTPHPSIIFIPYGPWASLLMNSETRGTGMPTLKGISAEVEPAPEENVMTVAELLKKHFKKG
jgi:formylmethanofuran dehydrogenase subunit D